MRNSTIRSKWKLFFYFFQLFLLSFLQHPHLHLPDLARQHAEFIDREALCKIPRPRVINVPAHPAQSYMPPCTILHRCTDDTGCCKSPALKCVPKQYEIVTLYFMVRMRLRLVLLPPILSSPPSHSIQRRHFHKSKGICIGVIKHNSHTLLNNILNFQVSTIRGQGFIEEKHFHNHTECHCIDKALSSEPMLKPKCQCPNKFDVSYNGDNQCVCDCLESNRSNECISKKAGIEHFSMEDRRYEGFFIRFDSKICILWKFYFGFLRK